MFILFIQSGRYKEALEITKKLLIEGNFIMLPTLNGLILIAHKKTNY